MFRVFFCRLLHVLQRAHGLLRVLLRRLLRVLCGLRVLRRLLGFRRFHGFRGFHGFHELFRLHGLHRLNRFIRLNRPHGLHRFRRLFRLHGLHRLNRFIRLNRLHRLTRLRRLHRLSRLHRLGGPTDGGQTHGQVLLGQLRLRAVQECVAVALQTRAVVVLQRHEARLLPRGRAIPRKSLL